MNDITVKWKISKVSQIFLLTNTILMLCTVARESSASAACDKSRKVFDGVTFGEISHGHNSNYTQVSCVKYFWNFLLISNQF